jgi:exo-beta-1,3-glucanase (GH17 family)
MKQEHLRRAGTVLAALWALTLPLAAKPLGYICYSPYRDGQAPGAAEPSEDQIREDFRVLAPLAKGIRTYTVGGVHAQIPKLAQEAGLEVFMGAWIGKDDAANVAQVNALIALAKSGNPAIKGLIVGNEVLLRKDVTKARLIEYLRMVKNANTGIPVTTADIYQRINENAADLDPVVDIVLAHVHPFWESQSAANGAAHVVKGWKSVRAKYPSKRVVIGETGFPSAGQTQGGAVPSEDGAAQVATDLVTAGAREGMEFMLFTSFDEAWKGAEGPVGANWGLWKTNRAPKAAVARILALPTAIHFPANPANPRDRARMASASAGALLVDGLGRLRLAPSLAYPLRDPGAIPVLRIWAMAP